MNTLTTYFCLNQTQISHFVLTLNIIMFQIFTKLFGEVNKIHCPVPSEMFSSEMEKQHFLITPCSEVIILIKNLKSVVTNW